MTHKLHIDADIRRASTLPAEVYVEPRHYEVQRERVFARCWQLVSGTQNLESPGQVLPWRLLEGCLDEPLVVTRDDQGVPTIFRADYASLQLGIAGEGEPAFDLPADHPDHGRPVAAYYFWLFPNMMFNFYPWGLSINLVEPLGVDSTRVRFLSWVLDEGKRDGGAGADLHAVELEDEEVVESCQAGVRSRLYDRGRYSPKREVGVHHFHRLLARFMQE